MNTITPKHVFSFIQGMNPSVNTISSMGSYVSNTYQQVAEQLRNEVILALPESSLAHKIVSQDPKFFSEKQLWVVAFELFKSEVYVAEVTAYYTKQQRIQDAKSAKLAQNKEASADVLSQIKSAGRKLTDYYKWLNQSGNKFRKEHFSKRYTSDSVQAFLSI